MEWRMAVSSVLNRNSKAGSNRNFAIRSKAFAKQRSEDGTDLRESFISSPHLRRLGYSLEAPPIPIGNHVRGALASLRHL